jgi:hypothetical protein
MERDKGIDDDDDDDYIIDEYKDPKNPRSDANHKPPDHLAHRFGRKVCNLAEYSRPQSNPMTFRVSRR